MFDSDFLMKTLIKPFIFFQKLV